MNKNSKFGIGSAVVLAAVLSGCSGRPAPDPYYVKIKDVQLAIPKAYMDAGSGIDIPRVREELRKQASSMPGVQIDMFYMLLNSENAKPWVHNPNEHATPNYLTIWLSNPDVHQRFDMPDIEAKRLMKPDKRLQEQDGYGLTAYGSGRALPDGDLNYFVRLDEGSTLVLSCTGLNLPNPICEATTSWHGLLLRYRYRHVYLAQWRAINGRVTDLLNSFTYSESKAKK